MTTDINTSLLSFLKKIGLVDENSLIHLTPMSGGVSSDIYRLDIGEKFYCLKQALPKLKVDVDWYADTGRSYYEAEWLRYARSVNENNAPAILAYDRNAGFILMDYLPSEQYPVWKKQLLDGIIDADFATRVGKETARLHADSHNNQYLMELFKTDSMFYQLRIEPYLLFMREKYRDYKIQSVLTELAESLNTTHITLIHGDVSPKNILAGPDGPVFLDAECAYYGDPAFDLTFCLNHLLLKSIWNPESSVDYIYAYKSLVAAYLEQVSWENIDEFVHRCLRLLPALMLARIDGKSPVEYLTQNSQKELIRRFCTPRLLETSANLSAFADELGSELQDLLQ